MKKKNNDEVTKYNEEKQKNENKNKNVKMITNEPTIVDFLKRMRKENENNQNEEQIVEDEENISTQEMIYDSRERREKKTNYFKCDQCDYGSASKTVITRHMKSTHGKDIQNCKVGDKQGEDETSPAQHKEVVHEGKQFQCNQCRNRFTLETDLRMHIETNHVNISRVASENIKESGSGYVSKRLKCEQCLKRFNKKETLERHLKEHHKGRQNMTQESASNLHESNEDKSMNLTFQRELRSKKKKPSAKSLNIS